MTSNFKISNAKPITESEFEKCGAIGFIYYVTSISEHDFDQLIDFHEFETDDHTWERQLQWFKKMCQICVPRETPVSRCLKRLLGKAERMAMSVCPHNNIEDQHVEKIHDDISDYLEQ